MKELLIIFVPSVSKENPFILNKEEADFLIQGIHEINKIGRELNKDVFIFSDNLVQLKKSTEILEVKKYLKLGSDEGEKMFNSFLKGFIKDYNNIVLVRSLSKELNNEIIQNAFQKLQSTDYVLGPLNEKGYYLLGMKKLDPYIFDEHLNKEEILFKDVLCYIERQGSTYFQLPGLKEVRVEIAKAI